MLKFGAYLCHRKTCLSGKVVKLCAYVSSLNDMVVKLSARICHRQTYSSGDGGKLNTHICH